MIAKHPPARSMPRAKVEVAAVPVMLRYVDSMPFVNVEVAEPCTTRIPVVVAPPEIVRPVVCVPPPIVDEAVASIEDAVRVPVSVGDAEKTTLPVPVSSESHFENCAEVEKSEDVAVSTQLLPSCMSRSPYAPAVTTTSVRESRVLAAAAPTQLPLIEKHPPARSMPRAKVDVAAVPVTFRYAD